MANFTPVSAAIGGALIGLSAVLLMLFTGCIAGMSGGAWDPSLAVVMAAGLAVAYDLWQSRAAQSWARDLTAATAADG